MELRRPPGLTPTACSPARRTEDDTIVMDQPEYPKVSVNHADGYNEGSTVLSRLSLTTISAANLEGLFDGQDDVDERIKLCQDV